MIDASKITDGITTGIEVRKQRGMEIAAVSRIVKTELGYSVPSQTSGGKYTVNLRGKKPWCNCPDHELRGCKCKHIYAVEYAIRREQSVTVDSDGTTTVKESVTITKTRKTYSQNWPKYNEAQQNEKREFQKLLHQLCANVPQPAPKPGRSGRPPIAIADALFAAVFKVYANMSARRFTFDLEYEQELERALDAIVRQLSEELRQRQVQIDQCETELARRNRPRAKHRKKPRQAVKK